jgi:hypothetical protein
MLSSSPISFLLKRAILQNWHSNKTGKSLPCDAVNSVFRNKIFEDQNNKSKDSIFKSESLKFYRILYFGPQLSLGTLPKEL